MSTRPTAQPDATAGGPADAGAWLRDHGDVLYGYAYRRLSNASDAEDAVQDAIIAAIKGWESFRGDASVRTWLMGILRIRVLDHLRKRYRDAEHTERIARTTSETAPETSDPSGWPGFSDPELERAELRRVLLDAVDELDPPYRDVVYMRLIDKIPTDQVCEILGVTPTNLWTLIYRAKIRLRDALKSRFEGDRGQFSSQPGADTP